MSAADPAAGLVRARQAIARALLGDADLGVGPSLGSGTLHAHQRDAAARVVARIAKNGGAMLAEPVGMGKTYIALAIARQYASTLILVPASLRPMWQEALTAT